MPQSKRLFGLIGIIVCLFCGLSLQAWAGMLSPEMKSVLQKLDPAVKVREDDMVTFANGTQYVIVSPQEVKTVVQLSVAQLLPAGASIPDLIELNDGHFLLKIVTLPNGRKTFPIIDNVSVEMQSGLLPQDFSFPEGFLLPTLWKSLSGNLLLSPDRPETRKERHPLVFFDAALKNLVFFDSASGLPTHQLPVTCQPSDITVSPDGNKIFWGCAADAHLFVYTISQDKLDTVALNAPVAALAVDGETAHLFISHTMLPQISRFDFQNNRLETPIKLLQPVSSMVFSPFRKCLYVSVMAVTTPPQKKIQRKHTLFPIVYVLKDAASKKKHEPEIIREPHLQIIDSKTLQVEKSIPALPEISSLYIQDEKTLWMASESEKSLWGFDLRWQEYSSKIQLSESPIAMESDATWLYLLMPKVNELRRFNVKTHLWADPIPLEPNASPASLVLDAVEHQLFVLSTQPSGVEIVNLDRGEWIGTERVDFNTAGKMVWAIPAQQQSSAAEQVRIKFVDGRLLLQTGQNIRWEESLFDLHGRRKTQTQPVPSENPLVPAATPQADNLPVSPKSQ
jgi:hypothetical protein